MRIFALTHVGKVRTANEDSFFIPTESGRIAIIADGMGGHQAGEVASSIATSFIGERLFKLKVVGENILRYIISAANREIYERGMSDPKLEGMGTTLSLLWMDESEVLVAHVGDSRAYLFRDGELVQMTTDHSFVNELLINGDITPEEALHHPHRNVITRSLGTSQNVIADVIKLDIQKGDVWLLCTDGLTNLVSNDEIKEILAGEFSIKEKLHALLDLALERGGFDNITILITEDGEGEG